MENEQSLGFRLGFEKAPVAQWIEQLPSKQSVVGSSPTWGVHGKKQRGLTSSVNPLCFFLTLESRP